MAKKILMVLCIGVGVIIVYSQVRKLADRPQAEPDLTVSGQVRSLAAAARADSTTFKVCKRMQDAGIARGCYPADQPHDALGVLMYHDETRFFVSTPSNAIPEDEWRRGSVGGIYELTDQMPYDQAEPILQKKVAEAGFCKAAIAKATGIFVVLPPDASCDLLPQVQEVLDKG